MRPVSVSILHPAARDGAGPLEAWVADRRSRLARHHAAAFEAAGATSVAVVADQRDKRSFGARLRPLVAAAGSGGLVILGSGSIPLATRADLRAFVASAGGDVPRAIANNRYSADVAAIARADRLPPIPDLPGDNALPRWLEEVAGFPVDDLRARAHLAFDIDTPLDLALLGLTTESPFDLAGLEATLAGVRTVAADRRAELLLAGRSSAATLRWLETHSAARVRAWVEERGLRAASPLARDDARAGAQRPPRSLLGALLDRDGPASLRRHLARFADAAILDTRVLLAHRLGADEAAWPPAEDRFASDLLLPSCVADRWLRELTDAAAAAPIPVLLGGHSLVGPGVRFVVDGPPRKGSWI
jgi:CTP:molybdopterin cytidylyltransferase MocA